MVSKYNDRQLRIAFAKVKKDIISVKEDLYDVAKDQSNGNNSDYHDKLKFDNFVTNVENELKALTLFTKELEDRISHIQKFSSKSVSMPKDTSKDLEDNFEQLEGKFADFSELMNEKIDIEINSLRLEFTEEIAKVYDRVFSEVLELKDEIKEDKTVEKKSNKKIKKKAVKKTTKKVSNKIVEKNKIADEDLYQPISEQSEKLGKLKKVMNWLFVDEEDEQIDDIKSEVKKVKDEDKEELY